MEWKMAQDEVLIVNFLVPQLELQTEASLVVLGIVPLDGSSDGPNDVKIEEVVPIYDYPLGISEGKVY